MPFRALSRLTHTQAVFMMIVVTLMWSIAGVVSRQLESAARFEVTFWRSAFTTLSLLVILPWWRAADRAAGQIADDPGRECSSAIGACWRAPRRSGFRASAGA